MLGRCGILALMMLLQGCGSAGDPDQGATGPLDESTSTWPLDPGTANSTPGKSRTVTWTCEATIREIPAGTDELRIWVPAPRHDALIQVVKEATLDGPPSAVIQVRGITNPMNLYWYVTIKNPRAPIVLKAKATVERREQLNNYFRSAGLRSLAPSERMANRRFLRSGLRPETEGRLEGLAASLVPGTQNSLDFARAAFDYVRTNVARNVDADPRGRGDTLWALDTGRGDSSDFSALLVNLLRARGIPARLYCGFILPTTPEEGTLRRPAFWADFFVPERGWIPVDVWQSKTRVGLTQYAFGALTENRIAFAMDRGLTLNPPPAAGPLDLFSGPHAEADQTPVQVECRYAWMDG